MCDSSTDNESLDEPLSDYRSAVFAKTSVPEKSKHKYDKAYQDFVSWKTSKNMESFEENVVLAYFQELSEKFKASSLYTLYSMLKCTICRKNKIDISKYSRLTALLKRKAAGSTVKQSKTFTTEEVQKFLNEAPDLEYLLTKVALIFGIVGGCKRQDLYRLQFKDVQLYESTILIRIHKDKYVTPRTFTITGSYYELVKKYIKLRPNPCNNSCFFLHYKSGKCYGQNLGINYLGGICKTIATFLDLPFPHMYTSNCLRKTSATVAVDADGDIFPLRRHIGRWAFLKEPENDTNVLNSSADIECHDKESRQAKGGLANIKVISGYSLSSNGDEYTNYGNIMDSNNKESNRDLNPFEDKNIETININIPSKAAQLDIDDLMDTKDDAWKEMNSFQNQNYSVNSYRPSTTTSESCTTDSESRNKMWHHVHTEHPNTCKPEDLREKEKEQMRSQNIDPLEDDSTKIVNINIPSESTDIQRSLSALVRFSNCNIKNVNIYYTK